MKKTAATEPPAGKSHDRSPDRASGGRRRNPWSFLPTERIRIGISTCLLGEPVRFDGGHKRDDFLTGRLGRYVEWVPVCPEVELGLGTPREPVRLVRDRGQEDVRLVTIKTGVDLTERMRRFAAARVEELADADLSGYVLKKDSPSCGMERVKVYDAAGSSPARTGRGLFARALMARFPNLPVEEEGRLSDPHLRENFIERVFAYGRLRSLVSQPWNIRDLVAFHTAHKLVIMAHSPAAYRELGRLVAGAEQRQRASVMAAYQTAFMRAMSRMATPGRHANVLFHMLGFFKRQLDQEAKAEAMSLIEEYRQGLVPLIVPLTLIRHHVARLRVGYLADQVYLDPHPKELMLRNHV